MARKRRYHIPGAFYHLMLRGNNGQNIFLCDADRCRLCLLIQEGIERYGHRLHAYCFMTNHIHLLIQTGHVPMSKIVHNLAFRYSQDFNRRYNKQGHLFQGRFKAILLEEESYFKRLLRYIHMNPVRAKLVNEPGDYRWSGHRVYMDQDALAWLTTDYGLAKFDSILHQARKKYTAYVLKMETQEELAELRAGFKDGTVLGNDDFLKTIKNEAKQPSPTALSLTSILDAACEIFSIEKTMLTSMNQARNLSLSRGAVVICAQENGVKLEELASMLNRDSSTLCSLRKRYLMKSQESIELKEKIDRLNARAHELAILQA